MSSLIKHVSMDHEIASSVCSSDGTTMSTATTDAKPIMLNLAPAEPSCAPLKSLDDHIKERKSRQVTDEFLLSESAIEI